MQNPYETRILRVLTYIRENPGSDLSLDTLADVAAMSRFHWHRVFRGLTGETVAQMVRRIRLHIAAARLLEGNRPVAQIAKEVGYPNLSSFTRAFTHAYGQPPATFRETGQLTALTHHFKKRTAHMFPITVQDRPALRIAAIAHKGDYQKTGEAFERLGAAFATRGLLPHARGMLGIYYDNPEETPPEELRAHAGIIVEDNFEMPDDLEEVRIPASRCAVLAHNGPYATLASAYEDLYSNWMPESDEQPGNAPPYEIYLNNPADTPATELRTDICVPLAPTKASA